MYTADPQHPDPRRLTDEQRALAGANYPLAKSFARANSRRYGLAGEELLSAAMLGLLSAARKYDPSKGAFSTYAYKWMRSCCIDAIKSENRLKRKCPNASILQLQPEDDIADLGVHFDHEEASLCEAIAKLDEEDAEILRMRIEDGMTLAEIGRALGCTRQNAHKIMVKLAEKIQDLLAIGRVRHLYYNAHSRRKHGTDRPDEPLGNHEPQSLPDQLRPDPRQEGYRQPPAAPCAGQA